MKPEPISAVPAQLGEGPVWLPNESRLYWLDIQEQFLHRLAPSSGSVESLRLPAVVGNFVPTEHGTVLLASTDGVLEAKFNGLELQILRKLCHPEHDKPNNRYNDGKCSPEGRYWFGSLNHHREPGAASLYVFDGNECRSVISDATNSNGLGWSPCGTMFYWIDTPTRRIEAFRYDPENGTIDQRETVVQFPPDPGWGRPDGMTVDAEGMIWVAHWAGGRITRWDPRVGQLLESVFLPVQRVSSLTFGGIGLTQLFVTTAQTGMSEKDKEKEPLAGYLFVINSSTEGLPANLFRGQE